MRQKRGNKPIPAMLEPLQSGFLDAAKSDATKRAYALDLRQFMAAGGAVPCSL